MFHISPFLYNYFHKKLLTVSYKTILNVELISALFVVCAGIKEAATGHWSFLNSIVLVVHCYFNVWVRIKNGWRAFLLRQVRSFEVFFVLFHPFFKSSDNLGRPQKFGPSSTFLIGIT